MTATAMLAEEDQQTEENLYACTQADFAAEAIRRFGEKIRDWAFQCPVCGDVASAKEFPPKTRQVIGLECIGRYVGGRGCEYAVYQGHKDTCWAVSLPQHVIAYSFPLAPAPTDVASDHDARPLLSLRRSSEPGTPPWTGDEDWYYHVPIPDTPHAVVARFLYDGEAATVGLSLELDGETDGRQLPYALDAQELAADLLRHPAAAGIDPGAVLEAVCLIQVAAVADRADLPHPPIPGPDSQWLTGWQPEPEEADEHTAREPLPQPV
jgi:hypothetical protein